MSYAYIYLKTLWLKKQAWELRVTEWTETSGVVIPGKTENIKRKEDWNILK